MIFYLVQGYVGAAGQVAIREVPAALAAVVRPRLCGAVGAVILDRTLLLTSEGGEPGRVEQ